MDQYALPTIIRLHRSLLITTTKEPIMIDGAILGILTWVSMIFSYRHFPFWIRNFMLRHPVMTDVIATSICFFFLCSISASLTAVAASVVCGLLVNMTLVIANQLGEFNERKESVVRVITGREAESC